MSMSIHGAASPGTASPGIQWAEEMADRSLDMDTKVLVTGADGFIGSHLVEALLQEGCDVRAFVYYNSFNSWGWLDTLDQAKKDQLDIFAGDVRDPNGVREAMRDVDIVFHLAALIGIPFSYHSPDSYVDTNIKGTLNVVQAARDEKVSKILITSTSGRSFMIKSNAATISEKNWKVPPNPLSSRTLIAMTSSSGSTPAELLLPREVITPDVAVQ